MRSIILLIFLFILKALNAQDSTFVRSFYQGATIKVPEGKQWKIERAFISANDGYNIKISQSNFKEVYGPGENLIIPYYCAEMELLSDKSSFVYLLTILEKETNQ
jgi:hypothetical protein